MQPKLKDHGQKAAMIAAAKIVGSGLRSEAPVLAEYAKDFYRWDTSSFIKRQHAKGRGFNRAWANALQSMMEHYVFPAFGRMRLEDLNRPMVEKWMVDLPLANQTRNQILVERAVKIDGTIGSLKKRERTGEPRVVALPSRAQATLSWWCHESPHTLPNDLIFFGVSKRGALH